jgi:CheY-like chemotaxis protein
MEEQEQGGKQILESISRLRDITGLHNTPIAFFTSANTAQDIQQAKRLGADDYIQKPCDHDDLLRKVAKLVS